MRRVSLQRDERGATAIVVAIMLVILIGFGALAVDAGAVWWDRKQLQNGADASALAIAQACANGTSECAETPATVAAEGLTVDNKNQIVELSVLVRIDETDRKVVVRAEDQREAILSGIFGIERSPVAAEAIARWSGAPSSLATIPFTVSYCQFRWQNGGFEGTPVPGSTMIIKFKSQWKDFPLEPSDELTCMDNAAHNEAGGGFGYIKTTGACETFIEAGSWVNSSPGNGFDTGCTKAQVQKILGSSPGNTVLIPLFDDHNRENGNNAKFRISGFAAIKIDGYCVGLSTGGNFGMGSAALSCGGSNARIEGSFVGFSTLADVGEGTGVDYGVVGVSLSLD